MKTNRKCLILLAFISSSICAMAPQQEKTKQGTLEVIQCPPIGIGSTLLKTAITLHATQKKAILFTYATRSSNSPTDLTPNDCKATPHYTTNTCQTILHQVYQQKSEVVGIQHIQYFTQSTMISALSNLLDNGKQIVVAITEPNESKSDKLKELFSKHYKQRIQNPEKKS